MSAISVPCPRPVAAKGAVKVQLRPHRRAAEELPRDKADAHGPRGVRAGRPDHYGAYYIQYIHKTSPNKRTCYGRIFHAHDTMREKSCKQQLRRKCAARRCEAEKMPLADLGCIGVGLLTICPACGILHRHSTRKAVEYYTMYKVQRRRKMKKHTCTASVPGHGTVGPDGVRLFHHRRFHG